MLYKKAALKFEKFGEFGVSETRFSPSTADIFEGMFRLFSAKLFHKRSFND